MLETADFKQNKRRPRLRGWIISVAAVALLYQACSPGRVDLLSAGTGGAVSLGTGGRAPALQGSGGNEVIDGSVGAAAGFGGDYEDPDDKPKGPRPYDPDDESIPCFLRGQCLPLCEDHAQLCEACEHSDGCDWPFPHCDVAQQSCVECLTGEDCVDRFGSGFPACSAGKCVQCQHEGDCGLGEFCAFGLCGECRKSFDCDFGEVCVDLRCVLDGPKLGTGGAPGPGSGGQSGDKDGD